MIKAYPANKPLPSLSAAILQTQSTGPALPMSGFEKLLEGSRPLPRPRWQIPPEEPSTEELMRAAAQSGALDFWLHPDEDVYTLDDGEPV